MSRPFWPRLGPRRELLILVPVAVLLLVVVSVSTLYAYREAVDRMVEERQSEALRVAQRLAEAVADRWPMPETELRDLATGSRALAVRDSQGRSLARLGPVSEPPAGISSRTRSVRGPSPELPGWIVASAPFVRDGVPLSVWVELPVEALWASQRTLRVLTPVVLGTGGALSMLLLLFLRDLLAPIDILMRRAREAGLLAPSDEDEIASLVAGFEKALAAARARGVDATGATEALEAIDRALGSELEAGLLVADPQGRLLGLNPAGAALLGLPSATPGLPLTEALTGQPELVERLTAAIAAGEPLVRTEVPARRRGESLTLGLALHPLRRADGSSRGFVALFSDLTKFERLAAERRLADGLTQLGELAAGLAHELRNSFATLHGFVDLLEAEENAELAMEYRREIRDEMERLRRVVDDFLAFARPGQGRVEAVDLAILVRRVASDPALGGLAIELDLPDPPPPLLRGDAMLLERALRNLARNAAVAHRATASAEPLRLALSHRTEGWEVRVSDRGPGVPEAIRPRLFQPFVSGRSDGTGLGLALAQRIIAMHSGSLRLADRPQGGIDAIALFPHGAFATDRNGDTS